MESAISREIERLDTEDGILKILAMDDERILLNALTDTLRAVCAEDDEVVPFRNRREFREYQDKADFDVAFLDYDMGRMTGIEFYHELKEYSPGCRFVIVTGDEQHKEEAYRAGAAGFVLKPYSEEEVRAELKKLY